MADGDTNTVSSNRGNPGGCGKLPPPKPPLENDSDSSSRASAAPRVATIDNTLGAVASLRTTNDSIPAASSAATMSAPTKPTQ